ncbi:MAG TPA: SMP-30/gluconolactonase/LRE family protein [Thermodesulfobacteriota bacterium]|nr:SMP-30/gluconolactonase/LRE family protein [Thermodesulfobacteriota bacterium]
MKRLRWLAALAAATWVVSVGAVSPGEARQFPEQATFTTLITTPLVIEGLTGDDAGNLYTPGRGGNPCPIWRINLASPSLVVVGTIPAPCSPSGLAFNEAGDLFVADGDKIWRFTPNAAAPPTATVFASGVPGANGVAFDRDGNLWTGDGTTGVGRVWRISPTGGVCEPSFTGCTEVFRIPAMANVLNPAVTGGVANVGRDVRTLPPGTINAARAATNTAGSQPLVANGLAFTRDGDLFVADTARGAIWKVEFDRRGNLRSRTGCDATFTPNTLCLDNVFVAHPILEGADGIALDRAGNIWVSVNERNAIAVVTRSRRVIEIFRNPVNAAGLRNSADPGVGNDRILEFPTSPFLSGDRLCTANSDGNRRDNAPSAAGEIGVAPNLGKVSCLDQDLEIPGLPLPVR